MCDVRQWYLKSVGQGLFDGQLSPEQEAVQSEIEDILLQGRKDPRKKSVNCILLDQFEEILENKSFNTENNNLIENENEYDETDIFEEDETEIDLVESSDREENIEDVTNASENSINEDTGVKQEDEEGNADTSKNDEITEKQTSDSSETNDVPEAQKGEDETNENVKINREKTDENNALENTEQEPIVKQDVDNNDGILTQGKKESGVTEVPVNTENLADIEQDIKQNTGTTLAQDEKMRGGGSVKLVNSDKELANQEKLDKSNGIENAKQEETNTKAEGASVSDNIENGSNVNPQEVDQTNGTPNIEQESIKQDGPQETTKQGKEDATTSIKVEDKTVDDQKEDDNTVATDITSEEKDKTILSTNSQNKTSDEYNIETTMLKEQDIDNSENPLGKQDNTADQKADGLPKTLVEDLTNTVETDKNIEVQFQNTGNKVENSDTETVLLNGHTTVTNDISNKKQEIEIDVKSLEFEKYQQTFGVCRIDQSNAADVFLIRYFIQVVNNTTEQEEDLINHASIDSSTKTKTLIHEETTEQENTIESKKQENIAENNGVPDEDPHENVEDTTKLLKQPDVVKKRDNKRAKTSDHEDNEIKENIDTSAGEDTTENDILNEEDNSEKSFNSKGNQKLDKHSMSDNLGDAPANILKNSDSKEDKTVQYKYESLASDMLEKGNIKNVNPNMVNKDAPSGDAPDEKNAEQNDEDRKQKQLKDHDSMQTSRFNMDEFFKTKTLEYSSKIQNLEILIMKLENQLLMEKLDKQNHSSTITRLENSILKIENEVLKLNHSHYDLRIEHEKMNKKKKTYLELDHVQDNKSKQAKELADQSTKSHELITEQQNKIFQLAELLKNQSKAIHHMKSKYEYLEDQNRMLFQMVMNQTSLMTQIMSRVQELSDQNMQHRVEAQLLKEKLALSKMSEQIDNKEFSKVSNKLIEKLDAIVSDKKLDMVENGSRKDQNNTIEVVNNDIKDESEEKLMDYMSKTKQLANLTQNWCGQRKMVCVYKSIRLSTCVPFVPLHWSVCEPSNNNDFTLPKMEYVNDKRQTTKEYEKTEKKSISDTKSIDKGENINSETENKNIRTGNSKEAAFVQESENKIVQVSAKDEASDTVNKISEHEQINTKITKNDIETPRRSTTDDTSTIDVVKPATDDTIKSKQKNVTGSLINEDIKKKSDNINKASENQVKPELEDKQLETKMDSKKVQDANTVDTIKKDTKTEKQDSKPVEERPSTNQKLHKAEITEKRGGDTKNVPRDDIKDKNTNPDIDLKHPNQDKTTGKQNTGENTIKEKEGVSANANIEKQNTGENTIKEKQGMSANAHIEKQKPLSSSKQMENNDKHKTVERQATGQPPSGSTPDNQNKVKTKSTDQPGKVHENIEKIQTDQKSQKTSPRKDKEGKKEEVHQKKTQPKNGVSQSVKQVNKPKKEVKETKQTIHVADRKLKYEKKGQTEPKG